MLIVSMQAFVPYRTTCGSYVARPGGHAGRGRDAKPGTSHQGEVTAILHAVVFFDFTAILLVHVRDCGIFAKYGDVKKRNSRHASRAKIAQAFKL